MSVLDLIFGSFNETEVYKKDCDLEKQVEESRYKEEKYEKDQKGRDKENRNRLGNGSQG